MPVRTGNDGKVHYYKNKPVRIKDYLQDILWPTAKKPKPKKEPYEGFSYASSSVSPTTEHSCSPEECTTCKNDECPNRYDDFIDEGEMIL